MTDKKITLLTSIGAGLEFYDFTIYAMLADFISKLFFPNTEHSIALIITFSIFAIGYFIRPIGGVIFGIIGDKTGRKIPFTATLFLMAIATFAIGLVPTYSALGYGAPILLLLLRMIQGISFGAEFPGSITFLAEHVHAKYRGTYCCLMVSAVAFGITIGTFITYLLTTFLRPDQVMTWGWRLPFFFGGFLALVGYIIRRRVAETPYFLKQKTQIKSLKHNPLSTLLKKYPQRTILCFLVILFPSCFIISYLCLPAFLHDVFNYKTTDIFFAMTIGYVWSVIALPFFGWVSDTIGRKRLFLIALTLFILFSWFLFSILKLETFADLVIFMLIFQTIVAILTAGYIPLLPEIFPTNVRYTGIALCYNVAYALSSLTPILINVIYAQTQNIEFIIVLFVTLAIITTIACLAIKCRTQKSLLQ